MTCEAALVVAEIHAMTVQALGALGKGAEANYFAGKSQDLMEACF